MQMVIAWASRVVSSKDSACQFARHRRLRFNPWVWKVPWRRKRQPTPVFLPGKSHGQRSLAGRSPSGRYESDMTERLHCHFSLSHIGEGNGSPLQCSCLENPRDGGARWAAVYGVAQSRTRLKPLSSSSRLSDPFAAKSQWTLWGALAYILGLRSFKAI